jgi:glycosyltransferase involved in cell wall biosynthesis
LAGARIATYDVGGAAEVVGSGGAAGRVVRGGDVGGLVAAVRQLMDDPSPGRLDVLDAYDWPSVAQRFVAALDGLQTP